jgi:hypothetical protein
MAITKRKVSRRKTVSRGRTKSNIEAAKIRSKRTVKGKVRSLKFRPNLKSRPVEVSRTRRRGAERPGKRGSESWDTQKWLIGKKLAHVVKEKLIADFRKEDSLELGLKAKKRRVRS